ncbi:hypothetical protein [Streptomyces sp. ISL-94]|uniref:hypothetical protein n=1 Tax=Streptomyces sp. ISL-94 TaxID=2819190 RepID=UPI001BE6DBAC|nr:hypothetical protein [Streptomyces sp. ISL-94]MBT2479638.1 hypothetical protein [Streptomyces sp. ISL-94]
MSGRQRARTALTRALTVACVVLLCVFGAGPAAAMAAESRPSSTAPAEPTEGQSDPGPADSEVRAALRTVLRGVPGVRRTPLPVFHVKQADPVGCARPSEGAEPALSVRSVRSVVLRC